MRKFGLIGFPLGHSFSAKYFREKFLRESVTDCSYSNFEMTDVSAVAGLIKDPELEGLNVTIPHKQNVVHLLHGKNKVVEETGACNCIQVKKGLLYGFNTDVIGFEKSLEEKLINADRHALILGTGGSSKAVAWVLDKKGITRKYVSRTPATENTLGYEELDAEILKKYSLIINCTPLGTSPHADQCPPIPYAWIGKHHYLFDLVYNPAKTLFLQQGESAGARIKNGADMLAIQAEASWKIWNGFSGE